MMLLDKLLFISLILVISLVGFVGSEGAGEVQHGFHDMLSLHADEKEFSYEEGSETGPEHWGELHEEWAACGNGLMQSPINISDERVLVHENLGKLRRSYWPSYAVVKNRGHDIMIRWEGSVGGMLLDGTAYSLKQIHWHTPSEHTINNVRYSLELHMVHENANKEVAVVAVLYSIGRPDPFLAQMEGYITKIQDKKGAEVKAGLVNPNKIQMKTREYYRYMGSLTTPPCTEGVVWTVVRKAGTVSNKQLSLLKGAIVDGLGMNARPTQLINDRVVGMYRPRKYPSYIM